MHRSLTNVSHIAFLFVILFLCVVPQFVNAESVLWNKTEYVSEKFIPSDPPPLKWSDSKYVSFLEEDRYGEEEI